MSAPPSLFSLLSLVFQSFSLVAAAQITKNHYLFFFSFATSFCTILLFFLLPFFLIFPTINLKSLTSKNYPYCYLRSSIATPLF
ncbi:hypothetical protein ERO13_A01G182580v2 [Gossypium hirsutum]|nr:hypothetical protein ERO13_A01G182580v2 [Gossypium hirsutum]